MTDDVAAGPMTTTGERVIDLAKPMNIRAEMARAGIAPMQLRPYEDAERGWVDPLCGDESRTIIRRFMGDLWRACERAEERVP